MPTSRNPPRSVAGLRVAVWLEQPDISPVDAVVTTRIDAAAEALRSAGAVVDYRARPAFDVAHAHNTYQRTDRHQRITGASNARQAAYVPVARLWSRPG